MKKTFISLAVAASMAASGAVLADGKVYGHGQVEVVSYGADGDGISAGDNARGRIGFTASEDLGGGLKGIMKFEFKVDSADGDAGVASCSISGGVLGGSETCAVKKGGISLQKREMMIGLKGDFGQVELGRLKTAYKYYGGVKYDPYVASFLEARGNAGMSGKVGGGQIKSAAGHNGFVDASVGYANKFGMAAVRITVDVVDGGVEVGTGSTTNGNAMTAGIKFGSKMWEAGVAIVDDDEDAASTTAYSATKVFGQYKLGKAGKISGQFEMTEFDSGGSTADVDYIYVDYQFKLSKMNTIDVAYGMETTSVSGSPDFERDFTRLAFGHKFGKMTKGWVGIRNTGSDSANSDASVIAVGLQRRFSI